jgi:hypothetical protein
MYYFGKSEENTDLSCIYLAVTALSNFWILILDFSDKKVVCGGHQADSCAQCPMNIGESWCNGECAWCEGKCQIKGKNCGEFPKKTNFEF